MFKRNEPEPERKSAYSEELPLRVEEAIVILDMIDRRTGKLRDYFRSFPQGDRDYPWPTHVTLDEICKLAQSIRSMVVMTMQDI